MKIVSNEVSESTRFYDNDIAHSMNLFYTVEPSLKMKYPKVEWEKRKKNHDSKKIIIIGDSFTWDIHENSGMSEKSFEKVDFWYYNQIVNTEIATDGKIIGGLPVLTRHLNIRKILNEVDGIIVISSEPNLIDGGWGVAQDFLNIIKDSSHIPRRRNNAYLIEQCKTKKDWREGLERMANKRNISLDSMISIYLFDNNFNPLKE